MNEKILVIDDEPLILTTIKKALEKVGYAVRTAENVEGFFDALSTEDADLLIMDLHLGEVNADDLISRVKKIAPGAKTLIMSGSVPGLPQKYFLAKPFKIDELRNKVREILDEDRP